LYLEIKKKITPNRIRGDLLIVLAYFFATLRGAFLGLVGFFLGGAEGSSTAGTGSGSGEGTGAGG
jgi:hypothetical protein